MSVDVSIIIPVLNEAEGMAQRLENLLALRLSQSSPVFELLIVDGGSDDATAELVAACLSKSEEDRLLVSDPGRARQMNTGARESRGSYLLFLHADTQLPPNILNLADQWLSRQLDWGFFPVRLSGSACLLRLVEQSMNWRSRFSGIGTGDQCLFVRRELFESCSGFADIALMEDIEFCQRLKRRSRPVIQADSVLTSSRKWEREGIIKTIFLMWRLRLKYFLGADPAELARIYYQK